MSSDTFEQLKKATSGQSQSLSQRMRNSTSAPDIVLRKGKSAQLPPVSASTRSLHSGFDLYHGTGISKIAHNRLAGLNDAYNTTGLFADSIHISRSLPMCVRCGESPNLCMKCAELECENTLTFYRKTRAAGAATLFTKAFVEAGYSKLIKFVVFRLLKNSCQARSRSRLRKKAVVEKLFGTNLVYLPFNAWRRYTRENILARKDKEIEDQTDRVKALEIQNQKLTMQLRDANHEIEFLKGEVRSQGQSMHEMSTRIEKVESELETERERVKSLSAMSIPFQAVCNTLSQSIEYQMEDTGFELNSRAHIAYSYNISDILDKQTIRTIKDFHETNTATSATHRKTNASSKVVSHRAFFAVSRCLSRWVNFVSASAGNRTEPVSGKSLETFLPPHEDIDDITDLRNGKVLSRVIMALIMDRQVLDREKSKLAASQSSCSISSGAYAEQYMFGTWPIVKLTFEEIEVIGAKSEHSMELLDHILRLANRFLEIKVFQPSEIFSGYRDWLWHLVMSLMNASLPTVTHQDYVLIDACIQSYYQLMQILSQREPLKEHLNSVQKIVNDVYTVDVPFDEHDPSHHYASEETDAHFSEISRILSLAASSEEEISEYLSPMFTQSSSRRFGQERHEGLQTVGEEAGEESSPLDPLSPGLIISTADVQDNLDHAAQLLEIDTRISKREVRMDIEWNKSQYEVLGRIVDEMVLRREHVSMMEYAARLIDSHHRLTKLRNQVMIDRRKRDDEVRLSTDVRQFLFTQLMRITDPHSVADEGKK